MLSLRGRERGRERERELESRVSLRNRDGLGGSGLRGRERETRRLLKGEPRTQ